MVVSATKLPENQGHGNSVLTAENDILKLSSSSPMEMKLLIIFDFDPFLVIFGHFGSKVTFLWVRDLGALGTPPISIQFFRTIVGGTGSQGHPDSVEHKSKC